MEARVAVLPPSRHVDIDSAVTERKYTETLDPTCYIH